jgi:hypothetical protein
MKTLLLSSVAALALFGSLAVGEAADSKRTAEYLLSSPLVHEGKTVTVDVAAVKPVHWKSPFPELAFFHAMTIDRVDHKPGGTILVAIPSAEAARFAKKYGTDFEGRYESDQLKGLFMASGPRKFWVVDVSGQLANLQADRKLSLPDEAGRPVAMGGQFGRPGRMRQP